MRIVLRALTLMTGLLLLAGVIGLILMNHVLAAMPMKSAPPSAEEFAAARNWQPDTPAVADCDPHS